MVAALLVLALPPKLDPKLDLEAAWRYAEKSNSQALLIMQNGKKLFERYAGGYDETKAHPLASGSKSFAGIAGILAAQDGLISLDEPASNALTEWKSDPRKRRITFRQLLNMTDGLEAEYRFAHGWSAALAAEAVAEPGTTYAYGPTHQNAFAAALDRRLKGERFEAYLERRLAKPLGIKIEWRMRGVDRNPQVAGGAACTARDWAKFGEWIRKGGAPLVKPERLAEAFRGSKVMPIYGLGFWVRGAAAPDPSAVQAPPRSDLLSSNVLPKDFRAAMGLGEQRLYVIPSMGLTVVRFGSLRSQGFRDPLFFRALIP